MPDFFNPVQHLGSAVNHQKMYDFERDVLRVRNPLSTDYTFLYDSLPRTIVAGGTQDWERYLVRRYIWNMIGTIYNQFAEKKMKESEEIFRRTHPDVIDDPYLLNEQIYLKMKRADDPEFQKKVIADCIVGLVSKFGSNRVVPQRINNGVLDPNTQLYDKLIDDFKTIDITGETPAPITPLATEPLATQPLEASDIAI